MSSRRKEAEKKRKPECLGTLVVDGYYHNLYYCSYIFWYLRPTFRKNKDRTQPYKILMKNENHELKTVHCYNLEFHRLDIGKEMMGPFKIEMIDEDNDRKFDVYECYFDEDTFFQFTDENLISYKNPNECWKQVWNYSGSQVKEIQKCKVRKSKYVPKKFGPKDSSGSTDESYDSSGSTDESYGSTGKSYGSTGKSYDASGSTDESYERQDNPVYNEEPKDDPKRLGSCTFTVSMNGSEKMVTFQYLRPYLFDFLEEDSQKLQMINCGKQKSEVLCDHLSPEKLKRGKYLGPIKIEMMNFDESLKPVDCYLTMDNALEIIIHHQTFGEQILNFHGDREMINVIAVNKKGSYSVVKADVQSSFVSSSSEI